MCSGDLLYHQQPRKSRKGGGRKRRKPMLDLVSQVVLHDESMETVHVGKTRRICNFKPARPVVRKIIFEKKNVGRVPATGTTKLVWPSERERLASPSHCRCYCCTTFRPWVITIVCPCFRREDHGPRTLSTPGHILAGSSSKEDIIHRYITLLALHYSCLLLLLTSGWSQL